MIKNILQLIVVVMLFVSCGAWAKIPRSAKEVAAFKAGTPCPATGQRGGACPGHQVDHANPLCAGGSDSPDNMQWLTTQEHAWKTRSDVRMCRLYKASRAAPVARH